MKVLLAETAATLSRNEALLLQQLHYLSVTENDCQIKRDGRIWVKLDLQAWSAQFEDALSYDQVQRAFRKLREAGLVETCQPDAYRSDQTNAYTINADQIVNYKRNGKLLIDDLRPIPFNSALAKEVGINGAAFIGQLDYWLRIEEQRSLQGKRTNVYNNAFWQFSSISYFMEQMPWIRSDKTMRMLIIKLEREGCIISMSGSRNSRRYSLGFDFLKRFGYVVPITPERKEFTDFHDEPYKLRKNDIEYLHSVAEAVIGTLEARKLDVVLLDKAVSIMGKPDVLNAIQGFAFKVTTTEYETLDAASLHECISYELSEYDYDDNRDIYRENVLQPV